MSDVYRYEFDENGVCYRKPDGPFVSHDDYAALHYERIHDLNQIGGLQEENARLKAEVERLRKAGDAMAEAINLNDDVFDNQDKREAKAAWNAAKEGKPSV
jgi:uncharacterized small protein (DUF1192 family)